MPRYDFKCANGHVREDVWVSNFRDATNTPVLVSLCEVCGLPMEKQACAPNFAVHGYSAKTGYSTKG